MGASAGVGGLEAGLGDAASELASGLLPWAGVGGFDAGLTAASSAGFEPCEGVGGFDAGLASAAGGAAGSPVASGPGSGLLP